MQIIDFNINDIKPYEKNPRKNDAAVDYVMQSIKEFGFKVPIVIDKDNVIVAGHTRFKAAMKLHFDTVPCIVTDDLSDEQIKAFRLADNKVAEQAEWDFNILNAELEDILNIDMDLFGFDFEELDPDAFGTEFELVDGDKSEICQMTFTLHEKQKDLIEYAIATVKDNIEETFGNTNKNGNGLYEVVRQWAELKK